MKNKILTSVLVSAILTAAASGAEFQKINTYDNTFTDVPSNEWYASEVASAYELGLMNGVGAGLFNPDGNVTRAEAVTMASRVSAEFYGDTIAPADGEWYQMYVNYAVSKEFLAPDRFDEYDVPATRAEVAELFAKALPSDSYTQKNAVKSIPDVGNHLAYFDEVMTLYKAGVVMGSDSYGNFRPEDSIIRAEAAAILNRVALPEKRLAKTLDKVSEDDAYILIINSSMTGSYDGISSGWVLDNRGGTPKNELKSGYGALTDIRDDAGTAYIRGINKTAKGVLTFHTSVELNGDGGYMELRNDKDAPIYRVEAKDNKWQLLNADGSYTAISDITGEDKPYAFRIIIDLDNNRSATYINNVFCGTYPLITSGEDSNILNFRYATTDKAKVTLSPGGLLATGNYAVYDDFDLFAEDGLMPFGWYGYGAKLSKNELAVSENGTASKAFTPVSGKVIVENWYLSSENPAEFTILSGAKKVAGFTTDKDNFYVNGNKVYENYVDGIWYRLRFELDTKTGLMDVKVNGRYVSRDIPFGAKTTSVDTISVSSFGGDVLFDNFKVFREIHHEDYVPTPVPVVDDYTIGINVCSLWQNGIHGGWSCITPYDDKQPILGYYDEGNPETADWEIKYLLEHGIDFQAFCFFFDIGWPQRPVNEVHLFDGFMNAKYSEMAKYCIIWEAGNGLSPSSMEEWQTKYVPYLFENFLKDSRYMVIDNKPVMCMFGSDRFKSRAGGTENARAMLDYLDEAVKALGYNGMIYLVTGETSEDLENMGFDGVYAYSWSRDGYKLTVNKDGNARNVKRGYSYFVPTISVGFNDIGWSTERYPLITGEDYKLANEWVRDTYLKTYPTEKWQENFVMLSTWNEYGEGTYIMPTSDKNGFTYLDTIREIYGGLQPDESLNTVPTEEQLYRINHLYPQYHRLLRKEGYYTLEIREDEIKTLTGFDFATDDYAGLKKASVEGTQTEKGFKGKSTTSDPQLVISKLPEAINTENITAIRIEADLPENTSLEIFYTTTVNPSWAQGHSKSFKTTKSGMQEITFLARDLNGFTGVLKGIRLDPCYSEGVEFTIKSVKVLGYDAKELETDIVVNGNAGKLYFAPRISPNGDILTAFDAASGLDFKLALYYTWNSTSGELTLMSKDHTAVFTVGKNVYTVDGAVKTLDYVIELQDGLPLIPINRLCEDFGYSFEVKDNKIHIDTFELEYYNMIRASKVEGNWDFNFNGDTEGWKSGDMTLTVADGYMRCTNSSGTGDPKINFGGEKGFDVKKYKALEFKVRYDYEAKNPHSFMLYFTTDENPNLSEHSKIYHKLNSTDSKGEWETYTVDLTQIATWSGKLKSLRLDVFDTSSGTMDIDYIRFIPNPDYKEPVPEETPSDDTLSEESKEETNDEEWIECNSYSWDFDYDGETQNWSSGYLDLTVKNGTMLAKSKDSNTDPIMNFKDETAILDARKYKAIEFKIKYKYEAEKNSFVQIFYVTDLDPVFSESKSFRIPLKSTDSGDEWEVYSVNTTDKALWEGQITKIRFDPFNAVGEMEFDYIKLVADPRYSGPKIESGTTESTSDSALSTFSGITNGDAEGSGGFIGSVGDFKIVEDPDKKGNHIFKNIPSNDKECWLYTSQYLTYSAGGKYKVSVDIKLASHGTDENINGLSAILCFNAQYEGKDHVLARLPITANDGWKTFEFEFTIDKNSKNRNYDNFCFYSNPVDGKGVGYYLDNIRVIEIG